MSKVTQVTVPDGAFDMTVWLPTAGHGPGILLIQEIFGVSDYIQAVASDLADRGYVVGAPEMFWRIKPGHVAKHDEPGLVESLEISSHFSMTHGLDDAAAAYQVLDDMPEVQGGNGLFGICFGGTVAYLLAPRVEPDVVLSFYGSGVPEHLEVLEQIRCPILFVFGGSDQYIPRAKVAEVEQAVAGHPDAEILVEEDAGHAFHNRKAPMFYNQDAADRAWHAAEEFLERELPIN
jgi:carboxymethylenebutenolidase